MSSPAPRRAALALSEKQRRWERFVERNSLPRFANAPSGFVNELPRSIVHPERITIGTDVKLGAGSELKCNVGYPGGWVHHPEVRTSRRPSRRPCASATA